MSGPEQHRLERPSPHLATLLNLCLGVALVSALIGALTNSTVSHIAGWIAIGAIIAAPLLRILALGVGWLRLRDRRYAAVAFGLLLIVATGAALAALRR